MVRQKVFFLPLAVTERLNGIELRRLKAGKARQHAHDALIRTRPIMLSRR